MNINCTVRLSDDWQSEIDAIFIGWTPSGRVVNHKPICTEQTEIKFSVDALVILRTFSIGKIYQLPMHLVTVDREEVKLLESVQAGTD